MAPLFATLFALVVLFGGLVIWPWKRKVLAADDDRVHYLKIVFHVHIGLLTASFSWSYYLASCCAETSTYLLPSLAVPYLVGVASVVASIWILKQGNKGYP